MQGTFLLVCLGNPGKRYELTRHNAGFLFARYLNSIAKLVSEKSSTSAQIFSFSSSKTKSLDIQVKLILPLTFMNLSGEAVASYCHFHKVEKSFLCVVYDDVDVAFGEVKTREKGGAGGHNGIRSLIQHLGGEDFFRIKVGIGKPQALAVDDPRRSMSVHDWVLAPFAASELEILETKVFPLVEQRFFEFAQQKMRLPKEK